MKRFFKIKRLTRLLVFLISLVSLLPITSVLASDTELSKNSNDKYRVELNFEHIETRENDKEDVKPNERQVKVFKLPDSYRNKDKIEFTRRMSGLTMAQAEEELKNDGATSFISDKSILYTNGELVSSIKSSDYDKKSTIEKIIFDGLEPGLYLFKETDESSERFPDQKLISILVDVGESFAQDGLIISKMKQTIKNPDTTIRLTKVDKYYKNKLDKVEFEFYKVENGKRIPVSVNGENGQYTYNPNNNTSNIVKTWDGGVLTVENLPEGDYVFVESKQAQGYPEFNLGREGKAKLTASKVDSEDKKDIVVENERTPFIVKVDETDGKLLEGAVFNVFNDKGEKVKFRKTGHIYIEDENGSPDLVTDSIGLITIGNIEDGEYKFEEIKAPAGYILEDKGKISVNFKDGKALNEKNEPTIFGIKNKPEKPKTPPENPKGGYRFIKTDDSDKAKRLAGAVFKVQKRIGDKYQDVMLDGKIYTVKSDDKGEVVVDNLLLDKDNKENNRYALRETSAPEGYNPESNPIHFEISETSINNPPIRIKNKPKTTTPPPPTSTTPPTTTTTTTSYVPTDVPKIVRGPLVKTGDIRIVIMAVVGAVMVGLGVRIVRKEEKSLMAK